MAPEQLELQQLAEQWHNADLELAESRRMLEIHKHDADRKRESVKKLEDVLKTKVGQNVTHKLIVVDKGMGDHVLVEHVESAHGPYVVVRRLRTE